MDLESMYPRERTEEKTMGDTLRIGEAGAGELSAALRVEMVEAVVSDVAPPSGRFARGAVDAPPLELKIGGRTVEARRAASCLLSPMVGDRVVATISGNEAFVLGVLTREESGVSSFALGSGVAIDVDQEAGVSVRGARDLHLGASRSVTASGEEVRVQAGRASVVAKKIEAIGASLESSFDHVRQLGRIVEVVADEVSSRLKRSLRFVSEIDQTRAGVIDTRAEGVVTIHGENTCVTARQVAKIDSNQIHIG
jgi:hypothetical protein